jgi:LysM repeat protein
MGYTQLRNANPDTKDYPGWCLKLVTVAFFGSPGGHNCAKDAWNASGTKNGSRSMPDVQVPVWFSWVGTIDGITKDWGHVVVWFPGRGFLSSPGKWTDGYGQQWFSSIEAVERWFGAPYLGFTLDIPMRGSVAQWVDGPTPTPTPTPSPDYTGSYTVVPGDTLSGIADQYGVAWQDLYAANTDVIGSDPNLIRPGMVLRVPGGSPAPAPVPAGTTYTVVAGDTLWGIAVNFYGDGMRWSEIYNANVATIGGDPGLIIPGQVLTIPGV